MSGTSSRSATPTKQQPTSAHDPILRPRQAAQYLNICKATLYETVGRGLLEAPIRITERAAGWRLSTLNAYLDSRKGAPRPPVGANAKRAAKQSRGE